MQQISRILYTILIFFGHLTFGTLSGITGPSLVDLQYLLYNSDHSAVTFGQVAFNLTFVLTGSIFGSFISFIYKIGQESKTKCLKLLLNRQLLTSLFVILFGTLNVLTPYIYNINVYYLFGFLSGIGCGNWNTVSATWLLEMWSGKRLASLLQALNLCFGLGSILGPLVVRPFLKGYLAPDELITEELIAERRAALFVPFALCGSAEAVVGILLLIFVFLPLRYLKAPTPTNEEVEENKVQNEKTIKLLETPPNRRRHLNIVFFVLIMLLVGAANLAEIGHLSFEAVFLQSQAGANMSGAEAAEISSVTASAYTAGRGLSVLTASWLSPGALISGHLVFGLLSTGGLVFTQKLGYLIVALNSAAIGLSFSALTPAILAYAHSLTEMSDRQNALFFTALLLPSVFGPFLIGPYLERLPSILLFLDLAALATALAVFICTVVLVRRSASNR